MTATAGLRPRPGEFRKGRGGGAFRLPSPRQAAEAPLDLGAVDEEMSSFFIL